MKKHLIDACDAKHKSVKKKVFTLKIKLRRMKILKIRNFIYGLLNLSYYLYLLILCIFA